MKCPKCQFEQPDNTTECSHCGIIFSKWVNTASIAPIEDQQEKSSNGLLKIALVLLGILAVIGAVYFGSDHTSSTDKPETAVAQPAKSHSKPESNPFDEIERKPPTALQKKILEEENKTLTERCKQGVTEMGGTEEDIKAHCS